MRLLKWRFQHKNCPALAKTAVLFDRITIIFCAIICRRQIKLNKIVSDVTKQWYSPRNVTFVFELLQHLRWSTNIWINAFRSWCGAWPQRSCICLPMRTGCQRQKGQRGRRCVNWQPWWMTRRWWRKQPTSSKSRPVMSEVGHRSQPSKDIFAYLCVFVFRIFVMELLTENMSALNYTLMSLYWKFWFYYYLNHWDNLKWRRLIIAFMSILHTKYF